MHSIILSDQIKINLLKFVEHNPPINLMYRSWELYHYPTLSPTNKHIWIVKTSNQLEKPGYVIVGFQAARNNDVSKNAGIFDHINLTNIKLFLNSRGYPYGNLNLDFNNNKYSVLYAMFNNFQISYYDKEVAEVIPTRAQSKIMFHVF